MSEDAGRPGRRDEPTPEPGGAQPGQGNYGAQGPGEPPGPGARGPGEPPAPDAPGPGQDYPSYGYPSYGDQQQYAAMPAQAAPPNAGSAVAVAVLGVVSLIMLFTCLLGFIPAIIALVMAPSARREIEQSGGRLGGEGLIRAGTICSWIAIGLTALLIVLAIVGLVAAVSLGGAGGFSRAFGS